jgi:RNA polymerase sigma factor (sigma-70 family)
MMADRAGPLDTSVDSAALELSELVASQYERLLRLAVLICRDRADAQDAVQAALERAWRSRHSLRDPARLAGWTNRIVVREALRIERRRGLLRRWFDPPREIPLDQPGVGSREVDLRDALRTLPAEQRATLVLHYYMGYSVAETAEVMAVPTETARSRLRLARARLRERLGERP